MERGSLTAISLSVRLSFGVSAVHVRGIALKSEIPAISEDELISRLDVHVSRVTEVVLQKESKFKHLYLCWINH